MNIHTLKCLILNNLKCPTVNKLNSNGTSVGICLNVSYSYLASMQPTSMNYYNSNQQQQQMMLNPRKCSAIVSPGQQMMMMNQRKCSTVIAPDHSQTFASSSQVGYLNCRL